MDTHDAAIWFLDLRPPTRKRAEKRGFMSDEPKIGPNRGNAGKGRPKGSLNKSTQIAKDAIAQAADELGGSQRLVDWAKEDPKNEAAFWTNIYPRLLPLQVNGEMSLALSAEASKWLGR